MRVPSASGTAFALRRGIAVGFFLEGPGLGVWDAVGVAEARLLRRALEAWDDPDRGS